MILNQVLHYKKYIYRTVQKGRLKMQQTTRA